MDKETKSGSSDVKSAARSLAILEVLAEGKRPLTFMELHNILGYPRSSLHALLATLLDRQWLEMDDSDSRYSLGIRSYQVGQAYIHAVDIVKRARPYLEVVRDALNETVQLAVRDGRYNVYIDKVQSSQRLVLESDVGNRLEAHATGLGKVLLAGMTDDELEKLFEGVALEQFTPNTIISFDQLRQELHEIRNKGYGIDREEYTLGVSCVAAPILNQYGKTIAAMSVSVPTVRYSLALQEKASELLLQAARDVSHALGSDYSRAS